MVNQKYHEIVNQLEKPDEAQSSAVIKDISELASNKKPPLNQKLSNDDDLIMYLSSAYENKRARQVFEWERLGRKYVRQSA